MTITWSKLHELLALPRRELTAADIQAAITVNLGERADLDFKGQRGSSEHDKTELAKDVAAMANTGGGLIVFGVGEEGAGTDKQLVDTPIKLTEQMEQAVRAVVASRVRPLVPGITITQVPTSDPGRGYLLVQIPDSPDAPHFYDRDRDNEPPRAPARIGPHTHDMRERQIERAYRERFARRADAAAALDLLFAAMRERLDMSEPEREVWAVVAVRPSGSVPLGRGAATDQDVKETLADASSLEFELLREDTNVPDWMVKVSDFNGHSLRRGLRRWVARQGWQSGSPGVLEESDVAEFHQDGTVMVAFRVTGGDGELAVLAAGVEQACAATVALGSAWAGRRGISGSATARVAVYSMATAQRSLQLMARERSFPRVGGSLIVPAETNPVVDVHPVDGQFDLAVPDDRLAVARELAEGVVHQFGWDQLAILKPAPPD